jgi:3-oxo-5-alpha-steroid 4-dehydrogenase 1
MWFVAELSMLTIAAAMVLLPILLYMEAPYGKFYRNGFGYKVNGKFGWFVFESVPWIIFLRCWNLEGIRFYFVVCWLIHYINRSVIYTIRAPNMNPIAISAVMGAILFNLINGYTNTTHVMHNDYHGWHRDVRFYIGSFLFWTGMAINIRSDNILFEIKKTKKGYQIPVSFLYDFISCPNYFGEILEWLGWAVMTWSLPGIAFFIFTCSNLIPRAFKTHQWYLVKFKDYPVVRKRIFPFVM